jgi:hypothetical protein
LDAGTFEMMIVSVTAGARFSAWACLGRIWANTADPKAMARVRAVLTMKCAAWQNLFGIMLASLNAKMVYILRHD